MKARILVAVIFIPLIFVIIYILPPIALPIAISVLSIIAIYELMISTKMVKSPRLVFYAMIFGAVIPFWTFAGSPIEPALIALFILFCLLFIDIIASRGKVRFEHIAASFFAATFIPFFLSAFIRIDMGKLGNYNILLPFVAAFISDAAAFFVGISVGKTKLAPNISPKKTVEGAVGGFVFAVLAMLLYGFILNQFFSVLADYLLLAMYGALGAVAAQLGDLSFSVIKRQFGIKDYGWIFPGHGGVLDRFDSVLFVAPLTEALIMILPAIEAAGS